MSSVGKSSLVDRLLRGKFDGTARNTIGAAFGAKQMQLPDGKGGTKGFTLGIWDTAGAGEELPEPDPPICCLK